MWWIRHALELIDESTRKPLPGICYKSKKPTPMQTPYSGTQTDNSSESAETSFENVMDSFSIADTPEAQAYLNSPIDVGRGIDEAADLNQQRIENEYNNAFMQGVPTIFRNTARNADINAANRNYGYQKQAAERARNEQMAARRERLLPQIFQKSGKTKSSGSRTGTSASSGYGTQIVQPQSGGLLNTLLGGGLSTAAAFA